MIFSLNSGGLGVFAISPDLLSLPRSEKKPLGTFAKAHLMPSTLTYIQRDLSRGRWVDAHFINAKNVEVIISIALFPSALNIIVSSDGKRVSLNRPKEVPEFIESKVHRSVRCLEDMSQIWVKSISQKSNPKRSSQKEVKVLTRGQKIKKIEKAMDKIQEDSKNKREKKFDVFANLIRTSKDQAQRDFPQYYDAKVNPFKLSDEYFKKHKIEIKKIERAQNRWQELKEDLEKIKSMSDKEYLEGQKLKAQAVSVDTLKSSGVFVNTRRFQLADDLVAYFGKSAKDNLKLLRVARAWNYWFHIKDIPSSHMLVFCAKNRELKPAEIQKAVFWFVQTQPALSRLYKSGDFVDVLMVPCRYVRPLKGPTIGRVTYSNEKTLRFKVP